MTNAQRPANLPGVTLGALLLAVFTVFVGFGVMLPLLPYLIERLLGAGAEVAQVSRHTGLLTGVYTLALFLFAPMWGRLSDRYGVRCILLVGLLGFGITLLVFSFIQSLATVYAGRFLSGMFAAAVTPVATAAIGDFVMTEAERGRRLAFVSMAGIIGFLLGPMLGMFIARFATGGFSTAMPSSVAIPLTATALLAFLVAPVVAWAVPGGQNSHRPMKVADALAGRAAGFMSRLFILSFIVSAGVGIFEVGLALFGKKELGVTPSQIALMFSVCSLVMFAMQAIIFFSPWIKPNATRWFISPALAVLAAGLLVVPWIADFSLMLVVIGAVAASAGILSPILTYWISAKAGNAQGWELGKQAAATSLGITLGSVAGGLIFDIAALPGASFVMAAGLAALGFLLSLRLPRMLVPASAHGYFA